MHFPAKPNGRAVLLHRGEAKSLRLDTAAGWEAVLGGPDRSAGLDPQKAFEAVGFVRRCVEVRAKRVAALPWAVYTRGAEVGDYEAALYTEAHATAPDALAPLDGLAACLHLAEASLALTGAAYHLVRLDGAGARNGDLMRFAGLQYMAPGSVRPEYDAAGALTHFVRTVGARQIALDVESVWHVWQPDPFRETGPGSSDAAAAGLPARALHALATFLGDHLDGGLIKATVLTLDGDSMMDEEQAGKAKRAFWDFFRKGPKATGGPPIMKDVTPHVIGDGLKDLENAKLTESNRQAICTALGVPWALMMDGAANYATAKVHERGFILDTIAPQAHMIARSLTAQVLGRYGYELRFEPERHEVFQQYELEKAEKVVAVVGGPVLTVDEGRALLGKPPMEADDVVAEAPAEEAPEDGAPAGGDGATRSLPPVLSIKESVARVLAGEGAY